MRRRKRGHSCGAQNLRAAFGEVEQELRETRRYDPEIALFAAWHVPCVESLRAESTHVLAAPKNQIQTDKTQYEKILSDVGDWRGDVHDGDQSFSPGQRRWWWTR